MKFETSHDFAKRLDHNDPIAPYRERFNIPIQNNKKEYAYFCGNSLGLMPKNTESWVKEELEKWKRHAVKGHFEGKHPWLNYHEFCNEGLSLITGSKGSEVVAMNTLSANLHFMMVSFYQPTANRHCILIEKHAFPSDKYAVDSQIRFHGYDPKSSLIEVGKGASNGYISLDQFEETFKKRGHEIALVLLPGVQYYTGQSFNIHKLTEMAHHYGAHIGWDLAHSIGNVPLKLHEWGPDFAVWCHYKYLNSGPGSVGGCFVHEKHHLKSLPRFEGWWGNDKQQRFKMGPYFQPIPTVESWQLSNPPIISLSCILSSLELFKEVGGMPPLFAKTKLMSEYFLFLKEKLLKNKIKCITPLSMEEKGSQFSLELNQLIKGDKLIKRFDENGIIVDWREPNIIRVAFAPFYNSFEEIYYFVRVLNTILE